MSAPNLADVVHEAVEKAKADEERKPVTLTEFLLERIAEDELLAQQSVQIAAEGMRLISFGEVDAPPVLIVRPARVLAECEAKRRIVEAAGPLEVWTTTATVRLGTQEMHVPGEFLSMPGKCPEVLTLLAQPYADHPDFDPAWAVSPVTC